MLNYQLAFTTKKRRKNYVGHCVVLWFGRRRRLKQSKLNLLFFLRAQFAGAGETGPPGDGEHRGAPADVQRLSYFVPATHKRSAVSRHPCERSGQVWSSSPLRSATTVLPCPGVEGVKELLGDIEGVPGHRHQCAQTFWIEKINALYQVRKKVWDI